MIDPAASSSERHDFRACETSDPSLTLKVCALLPEIETEVSTLQCAVAAAHGFAASICAVHVGHDRSQAYVSPEEQDIQQLRDIYEGAPEARQARIKAVFDAFVASAPDAPPIQWRHDGGDICANIVVEACDADLLVISHPIHRDAADALHGALFDARRLVLVAPRNALAMTQSIGRHMVVGWKPGDAARQAVQAALPWLKRADKVTVLWVEKDGNEPYHQSARDFFARLGVEAEIVGLPRDHQSVGRLLLAETARRGGDSLVIGAFRHGSLWELILGGVTRDVLAAAELPVFMMRARKHFAADPVA